MDLFREGHKSGIRGTTKGIDLYLPLSSHPLPLFATLVLLLRRAGP